MIKEYNICVESFSDENTEAPVLINGELQTVVVGYKLFVINCESEHAVEIAKDSLTKTLAMSPEFIKRTFPKFYKLSLTKQYWFHLLEKDFIAKNQLTESKLDDKELSLDDHLSSGLTDDGGLIDSIDVYFDRDLIELNGPPERLNFWEMLGLDDLGE